MTAPERDLLREMAEALRAAGTQCLLPYHLDPKRCNACAGCKRHALLAKFDAMNDARMQKDMKAERDSQDKGGY